jgi:hypothetical protein
MILRFRELGIGNTLPKDREVEGGIARLIYHAMALKLMQL